MTYLTMNKLSELMECLRPENSVPEDVDEFSPENLDLEMRRFNNELDTDCFGNCFSDADPGL